MVEFRNKIIDLDQSLSRVIIIDISVSMFSIMLQIYTMAENNPILRQFVSAFAFGAISELLKLIISCLINGLVYEENDKIYAVLDKINPKDINEDEYKEVLMFKTMSRETKFGFTIGGFAPLKKTTQYISVGCDLNLELLFYYRVIRISKSTKR